MANIKIIIERLRSGSSELLNRKPAARGSLKRRFEDDIYRRRTKTDNYITFYDLAQVLIDGVFTDRPVNINPGTSLDGDNQIVEADLTASHVAEWNTFFTDVFSDYENQTKQIVKSESYNYGINYDEITGGEDNVNNLLNEDNGNWTENGLKTSNPESLIFKLPGLGNRLSFRNLSDYKITNAPAFNADAVSFAPSQNMKIFFAPKLLRINSTSENIDDEDSPTAAAFAHWTYLPRRIFLSKTASLGFFDVPFYAYALSGDLTSHNPGQYDPPSNYARISPEFRDELAGWILGLPFTDVTKDDDGYVDKSGYPFKSASAVFSEQEFEFNNFCSAEGDVGRTHESRFGMLAAIVKKGDDFYYFWNLTDTGIYRVRAVNNGFNVS